MQEAKAVAHGTGETFAIGPICGQTLPVGDELILGDIAFMVIGDRNAPGILRHQARARADFAGRSHPFGRLVSPEHINAGVGGIGEDAEHSRMGQPAPNKLAVPCTAIGATRETQTEFIEALDDAKSRALPREQIEDRSHYALDFLVWIEHNFVALEDKSDRQREAQFALGRLVELTAMEARADDMQLRLRERALHP